MSVKKEPAKRPLPCAHLGAVVARVRCNCPRKNVRQCKLGLTEKGHQPGTVTQAGACEVCPQYSPEED